MKGRELGEKTIQLDIKSKESEEMFRQLAVYLVRSSFSSFSLPMSALPVSGSHSIATATSRSLNYFVYFIELALHLRLVKCKPKITTFEGGLAFLSSKFQHR